jgi:hypothetical protein
VVVASVRAENTPAQDALSDSEDALIALSRPLMDLVGTDGYRALLRRAEQLAARNTRLFGPVEGGAARWIGVSPTRLLCPHRRYQGAVAVAGVLAALFTIVDEFLGPEITDSLLEPSSAPSTVA